MPGQANPPRHYELRVEGIEPSGYETLLIPNRLEKLRGYGAMATVPETATGGQG